MKNIFVYHIINNFSPSNHLESVLIEYRKLPHIEFIIRNIWRLYGGWYDGQPANLKPPSDAHMALKNSLMTSKDMVPSKTREKINLFTKTYWGDFEKT